MIIKDEFNCLLHELRRFSYKSISIMKRNHKKIGGINQSIVSLHTGMNALPFPCFLFGKIPCKGKLNQNEEDNFSGIQFRQFQTKIESVKTYKCEDTTELKAKPN